MSHLLQPLDPIPDSAQAQALSLIDALAAAEVAAPRPSTSTASSADVTSIQQTPRLDPVLESTQSALRTPFLYQPELPMHRNRQEPTPPSSLLLWPASTVYGGQRSESTSLALHIWHDRINESISIIASAFAPEDVHIDIRADSAEDAAKGFLALCKSWSSSVFAFNAADEDVDNTALLFGTSFFNCNPTTLNFNNVAMSM